MNRWNDVGSVGIGELIIFIAIVLVAGIAATVFISMSNTLESQTLSTGSQTTSEVASGVKIITIEGHVTSGKIDKIISSITAREGSPVIDLSSAYIELSNTSVALIMNYTSGYWVDARAGVDNLFGVHAFPSVASRYGIVVIRDKDNSCQQNTPLISEGDIIGLSINITASFGGLGENADIYGMFVPERGASAMISFKTPSTIADPILTLQP